MMINSCSKSLGEKLQGNCSIGDSLTTGYQHLMSETRPGASSRAGTGNTNTHPLGHLSFPTTHCPPFWACKNKRKQGMWIEPLHYQRTSAQEGYVLTPRRRAISKRRKREKLRGNRTSTRHARGTRRLLQRQNNQTQCMNPTV